MTKSRWSTWLADSAGNKQILMHAGTAEDELHLAADTEIGPIIIRVDRPTGLDACNFQDLVEAYGNMGRIQGDREDALEFFVP